MRGAVLARLLLAAIVAAMAGGMLPFAARPHEVRACSIAPLSMALDAVLQQTQIVAIGTWRDAGEGSVSLRVDQALKGARAGDELRVNNREPGLGAACETYRDPKAAGYRFKGGESAIVLLEKQVDGLWRPSYFGMAVFAVPNDEFEPLAMGRLPMAAPVKLDTIRADIRRLGEVTLDPGFESRPPCNPPFVFDTGKLRDYLAMSPLVVIGQVTKTANGAATVQVEETLRGSAPAGTITLNAHWFHQENSCPLVMEDGVRLRGNERLLLFLVPDEFGVAQYRPAAWGMGLFQVNEKYVTQGMLTLDDLEQATGTKVSLPAQAYTPRPVGAATPSLAPGQVRPGVTDTAASESSGNRDWGYWVAGGGALLAIAFVMWVGRQK